MNSQLIVAATCKALLAGLVLCGVVACDDSTSTGSSSQLAVTPSTAVGSVSPMPIATGNGAHVVAEFGQVIVPENRKVEGGRNITAAFLRFPSTNPEPAEPIFFLPGGPGPSILSDLTLLMLPVIEQWRSIADVVVVEQRGNYAGSPHIRCKETNVAGSTLPALAENARQCAEIWKATDIDLSAYNILEAAADVEDIRRFLGYDKITLSGISFGSQWSLATMRAYPDSIARAFLGGIEGLDQSYDMPSDVLASIKRLAEYADKDESLAEYIPEIGLMAALVQLIERLEKEPVRYFDKALGEDVQITADDIRAVARRDLSDQSGIVTWPARILKLHNGDFSDAAEAKRRTAEWPMAPGFFYTLDCASGISDDKAAKIAEDPASKILGDINFFYDHCQFWDVADLGAEFRAPYKSDIPVLMIQGNWDNATPIENLNTVAPMFNNLTLVTANRGSHVTALFSMQHPEMGPHIMRFLASGETEGIPENFDAWVPAFEAFTPEK